MNGKSRVFAVVGALVLVVGGGASLLLATNGHAQKTTTPQITPTQHVRSKVTPKLESLQQRERTIPSSKLKSFQKIPVLTQAGGHTTLDISQHPVVFTSDWDTTILKQLAGQKLKQAPVLIVTWPKSGETLQKEMQNVLQVEKNTHLSFKVYAMTTKLSHRFISGLPDSYVLNHGKLHEIPGILPTGSSSQWTQVFN